MPNWCDNILEITGPEAEIKRFRSEVRGQNDFDFENILPTPSEMADSGSLTGGGMPDWYDWRTSLAGWGTKWEVDLNREEELPDGFRWEFHSAWSPPEGILAQLGAMYPSLRFSLVYAEGGSFFAGSLIIDRGQIVESLDFDSRSRDQLYLFVKERLGQDWTAWEEEWEDE